MEGSEYLGARFVGVELDIIPDRVCREETVDAARGQPLLLNDAVEEQNRVIIELFCLYADKLILEDSRIFAA